MGQKSNSNIFRLGKDGYCRNFLYHEKKPEELAGLSYKNIEIIEFIKQFLGLRGLSLHTYKISVSGSVMYIEISYFANKQCYRFISNEYSNYEGVSIKKTQPRKPVRNLKKNINLKSEGIRRTDVKLQQIGSYLKKTKLNQSCRKRRVIFSKQKPKNLKLKTPKRLERFKCHRAYFQSKRHKNQNHYNSHRLIQKLIRSVSLYTNNKHKICLYLSNINTHQIYKRNNVKGHLKNSLTKLRRYSGEKYYKDGINLLTNVFNQKKISAQTIANFLSNYLSKLKKHRRFIKFIVSTLKVLIINKSSKLIGIKIVIKGRINGRPRAKNQTIQLGKTPLQSITSYSDYAQATAVTSDGTLGVKAWVCG